MWRSLKFRSSDNLFTILLRASPSGFLLQIETSSDRSREFPDTSCSSVVDESCQTGGPFSSTYLCRNFASFNSLMRFFHPFFSWCRLHQKFIIFVFRDGNTVWKNKWFIIFIFVQFSCESWIRWFSLWWDSSNPTQYVPSWNSWLENSTSQKLDK